MYSEPFSLLGIAHPIVYVIGVNIVNHKNYIYLVCVRINDVTSTVGETEHRTLELI